MCRLPKRTLPEPCCQQPLTVPRRALLRSLRSNMLPAEGARYVAEALKTNSTLHTLEYAADRPKLTVSSR